MKLLYTSTIIALAASAVSAELTYYSGADITGVSTYDAADAFCEDNGHGPPVSKEEWCEYATSNTGKVYGMAPASDVNGYIDVEDACGIAKPTEAPAARRGGRGGPQRTSARIGGRRLEEADSILCGEKIEKRTIQIPGGVASGSGDPHFKTWTGDKFDYHGECDLVLVDNPSFSNGLGLKVHIRTTRVKYFSYIEAIAIQIGDETLEFNNDVQNFLINGETVAPQRKHVETKVAGFTIRRDRKAISIRLDTSDWNNQAKIDLIQRKNGFPAVIVDGGATDIFQGSLGLLGEWSTGKKLARDGETEMNDPDATEFALEWQVRDTEPMLFQEARFPQFPTQCTPPQKILGNRLGKSHMEEEAEAACAHWKEDKEDCIFDVIATRDVLVASEGSIVA